MTANEMRAVFRYCDRTPQPLLFPALLAALEEFAALEADPNEILLILQELSLKDWPLEWVGPDVPERIGIPCRGKAHGEYLIVEFFDETVLVADRAPQSQSRRHVGCEPRRALPPLPLDARSQFPLRQRQAQPRQARRAAVAPRNGGSSLMYVFLRNRSILHFSFAASWDYEKEGNILLITLYTNRKRPVARFPVDAVDCWCYDNESLTHWFDGEGELKEKSALPGERVRFLSPAALIRH
jgi:hypothetical protein